MNEPEPQFLQVGHGSAARNIAYLSQAGREPGILWLQGFKSEMTSVKPTALAEWTQSTGRAYVRFDYSGHGQSEGRFETGNLTLWLEEAAKVFKELTTGEQVLVGSSMGGNIALLLLRHLSKSDPEVAERIRALVLIAPAWDMTEELMWPRMSTEAKKALLEDGVWLRPSRYGDEPYPITRQLIEDGKQNLLGRSPWQPGRPVRILHGRQDPDVPYSHSERLMEILAGPDTQLIEVPDGEHRLSRPEDLDRLYALLNEFVGD
ncbi:MAG: alpha/beta hydrolase [Pseudomonadota bacterium]